MANNDDTNFIHDEFPAQSRGTVKLPPHCGEEREHSTKSISYGRYYNTEFY